MYKEILVPLDGSELAEAALPHAREVAKAFGARVTLLTVVHQISVYPEPGTIGPVITVSINIEEEKESSRLYLQKIADQLKADGLDAGIEVREGDPASMICDYAHESGTELIVMSTHGRSGIKRWVYGSVADRVLRGAKVPILLIRPQAGR